MEIISARLKQLRKDKHLTLREVSEATGISNSTISEIETGDHGCNAGTLKALADFYGVTTDYLVGTTDNPNKTLISIADSDGSITTIEYQLIDKLKGLTVQDMIEIEKYVDYLKSKKEVEKNEK